jgi:putative membrane protein
MIEMILFAVLGTLFGAAISFLPGLHVFNIAGFGVLLFVTFPFLGALPLAMMMIGMLVGYGLISHAASTFLSSPDDSLLFFIMPSQKYLMRGKGYEGTLLLGIGGLGGLLFLILLMPVAMYLVPPIRRVTTPHLFWILGLVILYLVQSEWPRDFGSRAKTRLGRLWDGWSSLLAGIFILLISGAVGLIMMNRPFMPLNRSFQNIMPAFVGLYAMPWVLTNIASSVRLPKQLPPGDFSANKTQLTRGITSGCLGGCVAAYTPIVTAGVGGLLAGHATTMRDDVQFTVSYGAARFVYYVGAFLLLWIPLVHMTRGGMGWIMSVVYTPTERWEFWLFAGALAVSAVVAFLLLILISRVSMKLIERDSMIYRKVSIGVLFALIAIVLLMSSWQGIILMLPCVGIGLLPVMFRSRRINCMGILLVPVFLNMAGFGPRIVEWLGLL